MYMSWDLLAVEFITGGTKYCNYSEHFPWKELEPWKLVSFRPWKCVAGSKIFYYLGIYRDWKLKNCQI